MAKCKAGKLPVASDGSWPVTDGQPADLNGRFLPDLAQSAHRHGGNRRLLAALLTSARLQLSNSRKVSRYLLSADRAGKPSIGSASITARNDQTRAIIHMAAIDMARDLLRVSLADPAAVKENLPTRHANFRHF